MRMFRVIAAVAAFVVGLAAAPLYAQQLTPAQKATLRTAIQNEPALASALAARDDQTITAYCNAPASPVQKVWRTSYSDKDLFQSTVLTEYINRSTAERQAYDLIITMGTMDPSRNRLRAAIADIFSGATNSTSRGLIQTDMTRDATWCEQRLGGTDATTATITAWRANWTGVLSPFEISTLLNGD